MGYVLTNSLHLYGGGASVHNNPDLKESVRKMSMLCDRQVNLSVREKKHVKAVQLLADGLVFLPYVFFPSPFFKFFFQLMTISLLILLRFHVVMFKNIFKNVFLVVLSGIVSACIWCPLDNNQGMLRTT